MAMSFGPASDEDEVIGTINTTPLVDVMLVLLIIFLITIPVVTTSVPLNLPKEQASTAQDPIAPVIVSVDRQGAMFLFDSPMSEAALNERLKAMAQQTPQPKLHLRGDADTRFSDVQRVMQAAMRAGIRQVDFVTDPSAP